MDQYVDQLMRHEDDEIAHVETLLQEAANSGDYIDLDSTEWDRIERDALSQVKVSRPA